MNFVLPCLLSRQDQGPLKWASVDCLVAFTPSPVAGAVVAFPGKLGLGGVR